MPDAAAPRRFELGPAKRHGTLGGRARSSAVVLLLAALFVPICAVGLGGLERAHGPEEFALVSPGAQPVAPAETDTASAPLGLFFPAGLADEAVTVPEPAWTRLATGNVDSLSGDAFRASLAPPPRPGRT